MVKLMPVGLTMAPVYFKVSKSQGNLLQTLSVRNEGTIQAWMYPLQSSITRELGMLNALAKAPLNPTFKRILSPRQFRLRPALDSLNQLQGTMEKFVSEAEKARKLLPN
jgi:hypothetical protein